MKEDFLHYVWQNKKFALTSLQTFHGDALQILHSGMQLQQSGPDFFNAQIIIGAQKWAGNVEIHLKASDWYLHHHQTDANYDNTILHVVWEYDTPVLRNDQSEIPVLQLKDYVDKGVLFQYEKLKQKKNWINCEYGIQEVPQFVLKNWLERLYFERLENKVQPILALLQENNNDWEATLFCFLAKNFGLNTNGETFNQMAKSIPFAIVRKESFDVAYLEALFFGITNMLPQHPQDNYSKDMLALYEYIRVKYNIEAKYIPNAEFFRLRPDNFPTIRLAQLAMLYHVHKNLFSQIIEVNNLRSLYRLFQISVSEYWEYHYNFEKASVAKDKTLSKSFIDLLVINTIVPFQFAYAKMNGQEDYEFSFDLIEEIIAEKNTIVNHFKGIGVEAKNAFESQALLQLKNKYCDANRCLHCTIGLELLKCKK